MQLFLIQVIFVISWSSGFIGAKIGTDDSGAINLLFWRFLLVILCLLPLLLHRLREITWEKVRYNSVIGFLSQFAYLVPIYIAIRDGLPAGIAAIIAALQPLITSALASHSGHERSGLREWLGLAIGFLGVGIVISGELALSKTRINAGLYALPLVAALSLSIATIYQRRQSLTGSDHSRDGLLLPLFIQSCCSLALLAALGFGTGTLTIPTQPNVWLSVIWLTMFSTFIAYLSLWSLLTKMSATQAAALVYLEPPVTLVWAALMFGDVIHWSTYLGILAVAAGILIARKGSPARHTPTQCKLRQMKP